MRARGFGVVAGAAVAASLCGYALAQEDATTPPPSEDPVATMAGNWEFSNADHDKTCRFIFRTDAMPGGYKLDVDKSCPGLFPTTKDIVAWALDNFGALRLLDASGNAVIELTEAETGIYDGFERGQGRFILQSAAAAPVRSAEEMVGEWGVARGTGKPICILTLIGEPDGADTLALKIKPGCDPLVTRFNPNSWHMNQGELVLSSARGQTWHFEENDANTWQRVPVSADPVLLVRLQ